MILKFTDKKIIKGTADTSENFNFYNYSKFVEMFRYNNFFDDPIFAKNYRNKFRFKLLDNNVAHRANCKEIMQKAIRKLIIILR